jgi:hypothetical protein
MARRGASEVARVRLDPSGQRLGVPWGIRCNGGGTCMVAGQIAVASVFSIVAAFHLKTS